LWTSGKPIPDIAWEKYIGEEYRDPWKVILDWQISRNIFPDREQDKAAKLLAPLFDEATCTLPFRPPTLKEKMRESELGDFYGEVNVAASLLDERTLHSLIGNFFKPSALELALGQGLEGNARTFAQGRAAGLIAPTPPSVSTYTQIYDDLVKEVERQAHAQFGVGGVTPQAELLAECLSSIIRIPAEPLAKTLAVWEANLRANTAQYANTAILPHTPLSKEQIPVSLKPKARNVTGVIEGKLAHSQLARALFGQPQTVLIARAGLRLAAQVIQTGKFECVQAVANNTEGVDCIRIWNCVHNAAMVDNQIPFDKDTQFTYINLRNGFTATWNVDAPQILLIIGFEHVFYCMQTLQKDRVDPHLCQEIKGVKGMRIINIQQCEVREQLTHLDICIPTNWGQAIEARDILIIQSIGAPENTVTIAQKGTALVTVVANFLSLVAFLCCTGSWGLSGPPLFTDIQAYCTSPPRNSPFPTFEDRLQTVISDILHFPKAHEWPNMEEPIKVQVHQVTLPEFHNGDAMNPLPRLNAAGQALPGFLWDSFHTHAFFEALIANADLGSSFYIPPLFSNGPTELVKTAQIVTGVSNTLHHSFALVRFDRVRASDG
jgi:hypothetical protein